MRLLKGKCQIKPHWSTSFFTFELHSKELRAKCLVRVNSNTVIKTEFSLWVNWTGKCQTVDLTSYFFLSLRQSFKVKYLISYFLAVKIWSCHDDLLKNKSALHDGKVSSVFFPWLRWFLQKLHYIYFFSLGNKMKKKVMILVYPFNKNNTICNY